MKKLVLPLFLLFSCVSYGQLWIEDFSGEANNATTGTAGGTVGGTWNVTTLPSGGAASFSRQEPIASGFPTGILLFRANQTGNEGVWNSGSIDISGTGMASVSLNLITAGTSSADYIRAYYKVDGGAEILFGELVGTGFLGFQSTIPVSAIVSGSSMEVIIRANENTGGNFLFVGPPIAIGFDDLSIAEVPVVYSMASTAWNVGTTWSTVGFTGPSCGCTPTNGQVAIIGGGFTVDLTADATVGGVDIQNTGTLRYTAADLDLGIEAGLLRIRSGGNLNGNGQTAAQIDYNQDVGGATLQVDVGGTLTIEDVTLAANASNFHYFAGGGSLSITGDILIGADDATLTNNMTSTPAIGGRIEFSAGTTNSSFVNNGSISATTLFVNGDNGNSFTNASSAVATIGSIDLNNGNFTVNNSGTLNQSGNFLNIDAGSNGNFNNLATGIWNWSLTPNAPIDPEMNTVLDCAATGNVFNYLAAGDQSIIATTYYDLILSNSGTKLPSATLDINGDLSIQNSAILGGTSNITVGGDWSAVNAASFTDGTRTVTFDGAGAQTINNTSATETFGNLTISGSGVKSSTNLIDINGNFSIAGTAQFGVSNDIYLTGNWAVTSTNADPFIEGANTVFLDGSGAQAISTVRAGGETFNNLSITVSGVKSNISIVNIAGDLLIAGNNTTQLSAGNNILLGGDWTVTSTNADPFVQNTSTVTFNGSAPQVHNTVLLAGETFNNLISSNSSATSPQITFDKPVTISAVLTMQDGNINLTGGNLTISASTSGALVHGLTSASGWIYGASVVRSIAAGGGNSITIGTARGLFPLGSSTNFRPFYIGKANPGSGTVTVSHTSSANTSDVSIGDPSPTVIIVRERDDFWTVATTAVAGAYSVRAGGTGFGSVGLVAPADVTNLRMTITAAPRVIGTHSAATGTITEPYVNRTGLTSATLVNSFHVASVDAVDSPLPIELLFFTAKLKNDLVELSWSTASEVDNDFFTIERASNIEEFETVGDVIDGKGKSYEKSDYFTHDENPIYGRSYYRLKQTDFDGKFSYSDLQVINYEGPRFSSLQVYPNPSQGNALTIVVTGLKEQATVPVQIYNVQGQKVFDRVLDVNTPGTLRYDAEFGSPLRQGLYIVKAGQTLQLTQKVIVD